MDIPLLRLIFGDRLAHMEEVRFENERKSSHHISKADHELHYSQAQGVSTGSCGSGQTQEIAAYYGRIYADCSLWRQTKAFKSKLRGPECRGLFQCLLMKAHVSSTDQLPICRALWKR